MSMGFPTQVTTNLPSVYVTMSVVTAKDLLVSLQEVMRQCEKIFGKVETTFTRSRDEK